MNAEIKIDVHTDKNGNKNKKDTIDIIDNSLNFIIISLNNLIEKKMDEHQK